MKRKDDPVTKPRFRSERIVEDNGQWFFYTREGTMKGPFKDEIEAQNQVHNYVKVMTSNMIAEDSDLSVDVLKRTG